MSGLEVRLLRHEAHLTARQADLAEVKSEIAKVQARIETLEAEMRGKGKSEEEIAAAVRTKEKRLTGLVAKGERLEADKRALRSKAATTGAFPVPVSCLP